MSDITAASRVARSDAEISVEVNGGWVLMNAERNEFYDMNPTASEVWALTAEPVTVAEIRDDLITKFDVEADVLTFFSWQLGIE